MAEDPKTPSPPQLPIWLIAMVFMSQIWSSIAAAGIVLIGISNDVLTGETGVIAGIVLQALLGNSKDITSYIVGGSAASDRKTELLAKPAEPPPLPAAQPGTVVIEEKRTMTPMPAPEPAALVLLTDEERLVKMLKQSADETTPGPVKAQLDNTDIPALRAKIAAKG